MRATLRFYHYSRGLTGCTSRLLNGAGRCVLLVCMLLNAPLCRAQVGAHVSYHRISYANGLSGVTGMAVDGAGDVFYINNSGVYETMANNPYQPIAVPVPPGYFAYNHLAVDSSGDVFFDADDSNNHAFLVKATLSGGSFQSAILLSTAPFNNSLGVAVDSAGDAFLLASSQTTGRTLLEYPAGAPVGTAVLANAPAGAAIAVDSGRNVFFLLPSVNNGEVVESLVQNGAYGAAMPALSGICAALSPCNVTALAVDNTGALLLTNPAAGEIVRYAAQPTGGYAANKPVVLTAALQSNGGVAVGTGGVVYTEDSTGGGYVDTLTPPAPINLGSVALGSAGVPASVEFTFDATVQLGSVAVVTRGAPSLDFTNSGAGTCTAGSTPSVWN